MNNIPQNTVMSKHPLVSVIVPAFNAEKTIGETLRSVLGQTHGHLEVIVVNDGSTDRTPEIVAAMAGRNTRLRMVEQANAGVAAARNRGIAESRGTFIAPVDADDIWFSRHLEKLLARMMKRDDPVDLVYGWSLEIDGKSRLSGGFHCGRLEGRVFFGLLQNFFIGHASATLIHKKCFEAVGRYDTTLRAARAQGCEDLDLYLRMAEFFRFGTVGAFTTGYRHVPGNMSTNHSTMGRSYDMVLNKLSRRRPDIPGYWYKRSRANFSLYLAMRSLEKGSVREQMAHVKKAFMLDAVATLLRHDVWLAPVLFAMKRLQLKATTPSPSTLALRMRIQKHLPFTYLHRFRIRRIQGLSRINHAHRRRSS